MDNGYGQKLYETVEMYADDQGTNFYSELGIFYNIFFISHNFSELWISDFVEVWIKMSQNGYGSEELVQGPKQFWTHF